ncbi:MAG: KamA family radical SAM protein [Candidatus Algichlamydia australiensis]|nr:KamA family radical SAM protein [Chlamydiales bacterium]
MWQSILRENFRDLPTLLDYLEIEDRKSFTDTSFPLNLPRRIAEKIAKNDLNDPLLKQFLPLSKEKISFPNFISDPVSDCSFQKTPKLLQKYQSRALLVTTGVCPMHCRYCFRQNYDYEKADNWDAEIEVLKNDPTTIEIILSGGDPLSLSDRRLAQLIEKLEEVPHLQILRFHTRFPIGIPERITKEFIEILQKSRLQTIFLVHTNHPKELDNDVLASLKKMPCPVLTQTVLLKDVNDNFQTLKELFLKLIAHGIIPYYLHQLDRVQGAAHFEVSPRKGLEIISQLRESLPGYAVPRYVQELAGEKSKTTVNEQLT